MFFEFIPRSVKNDLYVAFGKSVARGYVRDSTKIPISLHEDDARLLWKRGEKGIYGIFEYILVVDRKFFTWYAFPEFIRDIINSVRTFLCRVVIITVDREIASDLS